MSGADRKALRASHLLCAECATPRPAGQALCEECARAAVARVDANAARQSAGTGGPVSESNAVATALLALAAEIKGLRADLAPIVALAQAAMVKHPPRGPVTGTRTVEAPAPATDGGARVAKLDLDD